MNARKSLAAAVVVCAALLAAPVSAGAATSTWGQEVKSCNLSSCYPEGTNRGSFVSAQAQDAQAPGYAWEIQNLALNPIGLGYEGF